MVRGYELGNVDYCIPISAYSSLHTCMFTQTHTHTIKNDKKLNQIKDGLANFSNILKLSALVSLVVAHTCLLGLFLTSDTNSKTSLIGEDQFIFNRYFSMRSTHAHRRNTHIPDYVNMNSNEITV